MSAPIEFGGELALEPEDALVRIGMIALSTDLTSERDAARLLPHERVALHVARVAFLNPTTPANLRAMLPRLGEAAALLVPGRRLTSISFACTAASVTIGDAAVDAAIAASRPDTPVVTPARAGRAALTSLGIRRLALLTPYLPETTVPIADYFVRGGFDVRRTTCLGLADDRDIARVDRRTILEAAEAADDPSAEALFVSCTALPVLDLIDEIEASLGKPVVTSNQASLWAMLSHAGVAPTRRPGRLFSEAMRSVEGVA